MAIVECKECRKEVSKNIKVCPHCGIKNPGVTTKDYVVGGLVVFVIVWGIASGDDDIDEAACKKDLQCLANKNHIVAEVYCDDNIEKIAKYSYEWIDGFGQSKFSHFRWKDINKGYITYIGDKIRFQNGFGAWQNIRYECDFDTESKSVLAYSAKPGYL